MISKIRRLLGRQTAAPVRLDRGEAPVAFRSERAVEPPRITDRQRGGPGPAASRRQRRESLRWRLPAYFCALVATMLATFLWVTHKEVESTLVRAGHQRTKVGAGQVAELVARSVAMQREENAQLGLDPELRAFLRSPRNATGRMVPEKLALDRPFRRVDLWDAAGTLIHADSTARADSGVEPKFIPARAAPLREGVSNVWAAGKGAQFDIVTGIRADSSAQGPVIGHLRRYGSITSHPAGAVRRLIGDEATVKLGSLDGGVWTDFDSIVAAPPRFETASATSHGVAGDGRRWIGALASVEGTPWLVWVGFPQEMVLAPVGAFLGRMLTLGALFLVVGLVFVILLSIRLTQPLHALASAAEQVASGDYTQRVRPGRPDEIGRLGEIFNLMSDRVEEAHRALRESHEQTHFALAAARIGVWESHVGTGRMTCSDSMRSVLGLIGNLPQTREDFLSFIHPEDRESVRLRLERDEFGTGVFDISCRAIAPDGSDRWLEGKARWRTDAEGRATSVLGVSVDVTEQRELEGQLRQAQKMEAVGQLAGGIAHDFNNLLAAIMSYSELLLLDLPDGDSARDDVGQIHAAAKRAATLTRQLLAYSRKQLLQPAVVDLVDATEQVASMLRRLIDPSIELDTRFNGERWGVLADPGQMEQVLVNLVVNARDAMPAGGRLTVTVAGVELPAAAFTWASAGGEYVMLQVTDTGAGMNRETQAKMFDPFFTTKEPGKGTGLGLSTVYGIVKQSGGHIVVDSEPGRGTTITSYFPRHIGGKVVDGSADGAGIGQAERAGRSASALVLVIEDEPAISSAVARILARNGYAVLEAATPQLARQLAAEHRGRIDLILADVMVPGTNGRDLVHEILPSQPGARVIFMSGFSDDTVRLQRILDSGVPFIAKPFALDDVVRKVQEILSPAASHLRPRPLTPTSGQAVS